jgi:hypothetical protein
MVTLGIVFLLGILGMVVDCGWGYYRKQVAQAAVDSAVIAAVVAAGNATIVCGSGGVGCTPSGISCASATGNLLAGCNYAAQNGIPNANMTMASDLGSNTPLSGIAANYWVKATASEPLHLSFLRALGFASASVAATATGGVIQNGPGGGCVYVLDPTLNKSLWQTASGDLESSCGVWVNSSDPKAIYQTASATINTGTAYTYLVGGYYQTGSSSINPAPVPSAPAADPWATRLLPTMPTPVVCSTATAPTFSPGTYCGGISFSGSATFSPGLYIMDGGGFGMTGSGTVTGTGVTILLASDSTHSYKGLSINGSGSISLSAPTSGAYEAMLFIGDRSTASTVGSTITGTTTTIFNGFIYLPQEALTYTGGSNLANYTSIVCDTLKMTGLTYINSNYSTLASGNPIGAAKTFALVQ